MQRILTMLAAFAVLLAGCLPGQAAPDVQSMVNTAVAQTMEANQRIAEAVQQTVSAQAPAASPTLAFTTTVEATATFEPFEILTDTPIPTATFQRSSSAPPATPQPYSCFVSTLKPDNYEEIKAGANFEIRWNVKNTGTQGWYAGVDVKYAGGVQMTNATRVEIPVALSPGESYKISLTGKAPNNKGVQQMTWVVEGPLCYAQVVITVK